MLVLDSNVALRACASDSGFSVFRGDRLVAPPLMWSEFRSALHEALWRGDVSAEKAAWTLEQLERSEIRERTHRRLGSEAWLVAQEFGWAKTYDAEYVALARLLGGRLVTLDHRLRRGADRLDFVITPNEI